MVIAIDGPAGVGKSSVAKIISEKIGAFNLNSGNFYRAVTLTVLDREINPEDEAAVVKAAESADIKIEKGRMTLFGKDVEESLHTDRVDQWVAKHSAIISVRRAVNAKIKEVAMTMDIVAEGRDMTTCVFPDAEVKIFLDATPEKRAMRRYCQGISNLSLADIQHGMKERDFIDKNKPVGALKVAEEALYIDTSDLTIEQVCDRVLRYIHENESATRSFG